MVKRPRCCKPLNRGYAVDFGRWCGSNGSQDGHGFANLASAASGPTSRHPLPGVLTALGANSPALTIALPNAYFAQLGLPLMVVRSPPYADPHVRWCGRGGGVT